MAEQLSYQASHDVLTNLLNRREFEVRAKAAWISAKNQHKQHALCYLDLDYFKQINDTQGHDAGDIALQAVSHAEIGDEIPETLYTAVAEVLAYVFQLRAFRKNGGARPDLPGVLDVPPEMDPLNPASQVAANPGAPA